MSDLAETPETDNGDETGRCPSCDSRMPPGTEHCLMCGAKMPGTGADDAVGEGEDETPAGDIPTPPPEPVTEKSLPDEAEKETPEPAPIPEPTPEPEPASEPDDVAEPGEAEQPFSGAVVESVMVEKSSPVVFWMTGVVAVITVVLGSLVLRYGGPVELALVPTETPIPPTPSHTPTWTPFPTETVLPSPSPTITPTPGPTDTPQPPRSHQVTAGETLFGLSLFYNVSMESIADLNGFSVSSPIQSGQSLLVPWPTPTPPLEPVSMDINGDTVIADPTDCERYEIQEGDAISSIAARYNINMQLLEDVNRLNEQSILRPGDTICIPEIIRGGVLPPTPGPSPTPSPTSFPAGPELLYPVQGAVVENLTRPVVLQWVAVKDLAPDEWYMVEVTDLEVPGAHPRRGFTRQNSFLVPTDWRPPVEEYHRFRWRVSVVKVTGRRDDGGFIYTFGGRASDEGIFTWLGAIPTATPTPTPSPTPSATPSE